MMFSSFLSVAVLAASSWYFPLADFSSRQSFKSYSQYIDLAFYIGKENLFPNRFTGYHAGIDLEILPGEENSPVPVYTVYSGKIIFSGTVSGYGGVVLEEIDNSDLTALYGHINIIDTQYQVGEMAGSGSVLTYLGDGFTNQTGGERKHLHFAIYKGSGLYFKGYESTLSSLNQHWIDPEKYLLDNSAVDPANLIPSEIPTASPTPSINHSQGFLQTILRVFRILFSWLPG
jgi:murein DD-endopeptidase MepM/ murein hydrolase activator NlpD